MFPASVLAEEMRGFDYQVHLVTDARGMVYTPHLTPMMVHQIPAATIYSGGVLGLPIRMVKLTLSLLVSLVLILRLRPKVIIGFGGYPSFGPVVAGRLLGRTVLVHEQNAVLGRVNRLAVILGASAATSYADTFNVPIKAAERLRRTGNPLRPEVVRIAQDAYLSASEGQPFDVLIFGGSQGARVFTEIVPKAVGLLPEALQQRLRVVHQVQRADMRDALNAYSALGVSAEIRDFFDDLPVRMRRAHLMIGRGGASTVAELSALAVPSIIVPLPGALDQDQANNVRELAEMGGAIMVKQTDFEPSQLAAELEALMRDTRLLEAMSRKAAEFSELDAGARLARYADCLAKGQPVQIDTPTGQSIGGVHG